MFYTFFFFVFTILTYAIISYYRIIEYDVSGASIGYYIVLMGVIYGIYRFYHKEKEVLSSFGILGFFLLHLFCILIFYFSISSSYSIGGILSGTFVAFFKIIGYLLIPLFLSILALSLGREVRQNIALPDFVENNRSLRLLFDFGVGFSLFIIGINLLSFTGSFNIFTTLLFIVVLMGLSFRSFNSILLDEIVLGKQEITYVTPGDQIYRTIRDFGIYIIFFLLSINYIGILRPMPIGWDDIGVYMNFPRIIAQTESSLGMGTVAWQAITAIGFQFGSATQAFFMNQIGGWFLIFTAILSFSLLLSSRRKNTWAILSGAFLLSLPMIVFQQAKDMKVDPLLFALGISAFTLLFLFLEEKEEDSKKSQRKNMFFLLSIGIIIGVSFAIKFTSLMLLLSCLAIVFYMQGGILLLLSYLFGFIGIFTGAKLWGLMNVIVPTEGMIYWGIIGVCGIVSLGLLGYLLKIQKERALKGLFISSIIVFGTFLGFLPWIAKNIGEITFHQKEYSIPNILSGVSRAYQLDLKKVFGPEILAQKESNKGLVGMNENGQSENEDLGRYFGYEKGMNNYFKMPFNLTYQINQGREFTEISYLFLAFIPGIFLFLPFRSGVWAIGGIIGVITVFTVSFLSIPQIVEFLGSWKLPEGYLLLMGCIALAGIIIGKGIENSHKNEERFQRNFVFFSLYGFLFVIATFGIVWYGIMIYYSMLLAILFCIERFDNWRDIGENKEPIPRDIGFGILGAVVFLIWFIASVIPHGWFNLKTAGFEEFKSKTITEVESIFTNRPDYIEPLSILNIGNKEAFLKSVYETNKITPTEDDLKTNPLQLIFRINNFIENKKNSVSLEERQAVTNAKRLKYELLSGIYEPKEAFTNTGIIYRVGTFFTYYIHNSQGRYIDDSLLGLFQKYIFEEKPEDTLKNFEKFGAQYLLIDLNAATIDQDPKRNLTRRFEDLVSLFQNKKLRLASTDSICLMLALEKSRLGKIQKEEDFIHLSTVNSESYREQSGSLITINRGEKLYGCYNTILGLVYNNEVNREQYSFLLPFVPGINEFKNDAKNLGRFMEANIRGGWYALFELVPENTSSTKKEESKK